MVTETASANTRPAERTVKPQLPRAVASVPGTSFKAEAESDTLEEAQAAVLRKIDGIIDQAIGGYAKGGVQGYDRNKLLKDSVEVNPPIPEPEE